MMPAYMRHSMRCLDAREQRDSPGVCCTVGVHSKQQLVKARLPRKTVSV